MHCDDRLTRLDRTARRIDATDEHPLKIRVVARLTGPGARHHACLCYPPTASRLPTLSTANRHQASCSARAVSVSVLTRPSSVTPKLRVWTWICSGWGIRGSSSSTSDNASLTSSSLSCSGGSTSRQSTTSRQPGVLLVCLPVLCLCVWLCSLSSRVTIPAFTETRISPLESSPPDSCTIRAPPFFTARSVQFFNSAAPSNEAVRLSSNAPSPLRSEGTTCRRSTTPRTLCQDPAISSARFLAATLPTSPSRTSASSVVNSMLTGQRCRSMRDSRSSAARTDLTVE